VRNPRRVGLNSGRVGRCGQAGPVGPGGVGWLAGSVCVQLGLC
jgi:hypothetical protein